MESSHSPHYGVEEDRLLRPRSLALHDWCARALSKWSDLQYLRERHPAVEVDVSATSDGYLQGTVDEHATIKMPFAKFLAQIDDETEGAGSWLLQPSSLRYHLAQCPLVTLPELHSDAWPPPPCVPSARVENQSANLWFALGKTTSSLHYDAFHNLLVVVRGVKRLLLLPPAATQALRPRAAHGPSANHTTLTTHQLHDLLPSLEDDVVRFELKRGEALLLPEGWWHEVESTEDITIAINYWWPGPLGQLAEPPPSVLLDDHRSATALLLRTSFAAAVRYERSRALHQLGGGDETGGEGCKCAMAALGATPDEVAGLLRAAQAGTEALLFALRGRSPHALLCALEAAAARSPRRVARLITHTLTPPTAHVLCARLDQAVQSACAACSRRAARQIEIILNVVPADARASIRSKMVALGRQFDNLVAANVLRDILGLDDELLCASTADLRAFRSAVTSEPDVACYRGGQKRKRHGSSRFAEGT
ncbi:hypothetical protein AB1Y20_002179 [Prymnesium parvum]|uniref:JmjC domain-containing protein n=1 Tax=Prymnesium parvum TaxID=97485 RepID=A0AB34JAJ2_PRYPA